MGHYTVEQLRERGIEVKLNTRLESVRRRPRRALRRRRSSTPTRIVWTAGVKASPVLGDCRTCRSTTAAGSRHAPTSGRGRRRRLGGRRQRRGARPDQAPASCAARAPSTPSGRPRCWPTTSSPRLRGEPLRDYRHKYAGSVASLGLHKGVAAGLRHQAQGLAGVADAPHLPLEPDADENKKVRVGLDWALALFFTRDIASLGSLEHPREEFERASR